MALNHEKPAEVVDDSVESPPSKTTMSDAKRDDSDLEPIELEKSATEEYPHGARLAALVVSLLLSMFLVALDNVSCSQPQPIKTDRI